MVSCGSQAKVGHQPLPIGELKCGLSRSMTNNTNGAGQVGNMKQRDRAGIIDDNARRNRNRLKT